VLEDVQAGATTLPAEVEETVLPVGPTGEVAVRIYRPKGTQGPLPVVMYFARNAVKRHADDFWAVASVAELVLTAHLLGGSETEEEAIQAYARAATMRTKPDQLMSVVNQLELYRRAGDPAELIDRIQALWRSSTATPTGTGRAAGRTTRSPSRGDAAGSSTG